MNQLYVYIHPLPPAQSSQPGKSHSKPADVFSSNVVGISLICRLPFPQLLVTSPYFSGGTACLYSVWRGWGCKAGYSAPLAIGISQVGEPLIEAELTGFLAWDFTHGSWKREDLSLLKVAP